MFTFPWPQSLPTVHSAPWVLQTPSFVPSLVPLFSFSYRPKTVILLLGSLCLTPDNAVWIFSPFIPNVYCHAVPLTVEDRDLFPTPFIWIISSFPLVDGIVHSRLEGSSDSGGLHMPPGEPDDVDCEGGGGKSANQ